MKENTTTLIIEDNPGDAIILREQLDHAGWNSDSSELKVRLQDAIESLKHKKPAIVFLDLNLPDSKGLETFLTINSIVPDIPIIILSGMNDTSLSLQAVKAGAQDYLVKGEFEEKILLKTILYGIERKKNLLRIEEANMRYMLASKATNDPLWDWDILLNKTYWNEKVQIFGYHNIKRVDRAWRLNNIHVEDKELVIKSLDTALENGKDQWSSEYRFRCADGTYKHILDRGYILRDRNQKPTRMIGTMQDITEKIKQQELDINKKEEHQRAILKAIIEGQEKERSYISKELHDNINQILTSANIYLGMANKKNLDKTIEVVETSRGFVKSAIDEIKKLSRAMSASQLDDIGLKSAIEDLRDKINLLQICKLRFVHSGNFQQVSKDISLTIFRVIQEQLNNIVKHSKAENAIVSIDIEDDKIRLEISDNGKGAKQHEYKKTDGMGLSNINNRIHSHNGSVEIITNPGNGFEMHVEIPI